MKIKLINYSPNPLKGLWLAAKVCYQKGDIGFLEEKFKENDAVLLLKKIYDKKHLSIFEQSFFQFDIDEVSRSLMAQLTRHRIGWSYAVQSQHYQKHMDFKFKDLEQYIDEDNKKEYYKLMGTINNFYKNAVESGMPRYIAREVLPNSCLVHIIASTNLRALDHFWGLRKGVENTPEIRVLAENTYNEILNVMPELEKIITY